ncbi:predicted protein [Naegleria gruberi]|uniref:Predicted protein n=1 Tax=Naegleria gruberi TaxID=5762 RepID=D2VG90_NAEGR|nr:uncharacterized protein NAEGRDRAFT_67895 [Naegleria gruberi]EFC44229.1 predicted protein [Naegleria gruberi]|eukprot:XP_002676973.1 predicted protein [Naegleria gruberi strain NEG-M]
MKIDATDRIPLIEDELPSSDEVVQKSSDRNSRREVTLSESVGSIVSTIFEVESLPGIILRGCDTNTDWTMDELDQLTKQFQILYGNGTKRTKKIIEQIKKIDKELELKGSNTPSNTSRKRKHYDDDDEDDSSDEQTENTNVQSARRCFCPSLSKKKNPSATVAWEKYTKRSNRGNVNSVSLRYNSNLAATMANGHRQATLVLEASLQKTTPLMGSSKKERMDEMQLSTLLVAAATVDRQKLSTGNVENSNSITEQQASTNVTTTTTTQQASLVVSSTSEQVQEQTANPPPQVDQIPSIQTTSSSTYPPMYNNQVPVDETSSSNFILPPLSQSHNYPYT